MTADRFLAARLALNLSQSALGATLGWAGNRMVSSLETGQRPIQPHTALAVECLLRRQRRWRAFCATSTASTED